MSESELYAMLKVKLAELKKKNLTPTIVYIDKYSFKKLAYIAYSLIVDKNGNVQQGIYGTIMGIPLYVLNEEKEIMDVGFDAIVRGLYED